MARSISTEGYVHRLRLDDHDGGAAVPIRIRPVEVPSIARTAVRGAAVLLTAIGFFAVTVVAFS